MAVPKRLKAIFEVAIEAGWTPDETEEGHPRLNPPTGVTDPYRQGRLAAPLTFSKTPSDNRGDANGVAYLRRLGVDIPHKGYTKKKDGK